MFQYLEKLRNKPEGERKKSVLLISLLVTLFIFLVWAATLSFRIGKTDFTFDSETNDKKMPSLVETFSGFIDQVGEIINDGTTYENKGL